MKATGLSLPADPHLPYSNTIKANIPCLFQDPLQLVGIDSKEKEGEKNPKSDEC
jgi:hypothetical protein